MMKADDGEMTSDDRKMKWEARAAENFIDTPQPLLAHLFLL
jgi:hypothetical protein